MKKYIAIVGTIAAGKTTAAKFLEKTYGYEIYKLTLAIYEEADKIGVDRTDRVILQDLGDKLREELGVAALSIKAIQRIKMNPERMYVIESIRNHNEVIKLKEELGNDLVVISIDAPIELRYQRAVKREGQYKEQDMTFEQFKINDERDLGIANAENEQNVFRCMELADHKIENIGRLDELEDKLLNLLS